MDFKATKKTTVTIQVIISLLVCLSHLVAPTSSSQISQTRTTDLQVTNTATSNDKILVQTTSGLIEGTSGANQSVYKFLSVPYAHAPIGELRFKRPVELTNFANQQIVDASRFGKTCPQYRHLARFISPLLNLDHEHQTSEDCLRLSLYVPNVVGQTTNGSQLEPNQRVPVIVWIPGEGFDFADERQFDGSQLAQRTQSIVVSVQYRVGILGFLSDAQLNVTGNMGAYDQLAALRWVKRNIHAFGGDDKRITLMGRFSGSMTISTMLTAPNQQLVTSESGDPLFQRVVMLSGLAVRDWIIDQPTGQATHIEQVLKTALERNYCSQEQVEQRSCLQRLPIEQLMEIAGYGWKLVVDNELIGQLDPVEVMREQPDQLNANVEAIMLGETETEGTLCLYRHMLMAGQSNYAQLIDEDKLTSGDLYEMIRDDSTTYFKYNLTRTNPIQMALEAAAGETSQELRNQYLDACSSYMVKAHNERFKRHLEARNRQLDQSVTSKPVHVYHYSLKYKPSFSLAPEYIQTAAHGDDVPLIFGLVHNQPKQSRSQEDLIMTQKMMSYIGNFVHGNHPLLEQHNAIGENNETSAKRISWAVSSGHKTTIHSLGLSESDSREQDNGARSGIQQQDYEPSIKPNPMRVILLDGQQVVALISNQQDHQLVASETEQQVDRTTAETTMSQAKPLTRSQRLLDLHNDHHRQQLARRGGERSTTQRKNQILYTTTEGTTTNNGQQTANIQATTTTTTTTTTNLFGAEMSFVSVLMLSSCVVIFTLMSICIILSVIVIRFYSFNNGASVSLSGVSGSNNASATSSTTRLSAACQQNSQHNFNGSSSTCNICDHSVQVNANLDAVLNGASTKTNNVFAKLHNNQQQHQQQTRNTVAQVQASQPNEMNILQHQHHQIESTPTTNASHRVNSQQ